MSAMTPREAADLLWSGKDAGRDAGRLAYDEIEALQVLIDHARECDADGRPAMREEGS